MYVMKTLSQKLGYLMILTMLSALIFSCTKSTMPEAVPAFFDSNTKPGDISKWLEGNVGKTTPYKNNIINKVLQNAVFDKMYTEPFRDNERLIIVPLRQEYFSQHVNKKNPHPLQYLLLVEDANGKIRRGDIVLFNPADHKLKALPKNAFHDFFEEDTFPADGTFAVVTLGDVKEFEMDYKNGRKAQFRVWHGDKKGDKENTANRDGMYCTYWYLVTTTYWADGHTEVNVEYLGPSCSTCAPNQLCDHLDDDGGGPGQGEPGTQINRDVSFIVKEMVTSYEQWKITGDFTLSGIKFNNAANNVFTGIISKGAVCLYADFPFTQSPNLSRYSIFTSGHSEGLVNSTTASGSVTAHMYYPNWPVSDNGPKTENYSMPHVWQASTELY